MATAALVTWLVTAVFGATMLTMWARAGGLRAAGVGAGAGGGTATTTVPGRREAAPGGEAARGGTAFPPALVFGHFLLAVAGLVLWIVFLATGVGPLTWVSFALLLLVVGGGAVLFGRWTGEHPSGRAESRLPKPVVYLHGVFAVVTLLLVLLAALGIGGRA
jgi:hypothetical protein